MDRINSLLKDANDKHATWKKVQAEKDAEAGTVGDKDSTDKLHEQP